MVDIQDYVSDDNPIMSHDDLEDAIERREKLEAVGDFGDEWTDLVKHINEFSRFLELHYEDSLKQD